MSLRGTHSTYCYVGQVIEDADAVELTLTDESLLSAVVLRSDLPVALWVSFPNRKAVPVGLRTRRDGADLAAVDLPAEWPGNGITSWAYR
jgi:hypothetical protein